MGEILETVMLICFGCSWPINLIKNYRCHSAKGMSLPFILLLIIGYIAGIIAKLSIGVTLQNSYVFAIYLINLIMVIANLFVYFRNLALDRKAELCEKGRSYQIIVDSISTQAKTDEHSFFRRKRAAVKSQTIQFAPCTDPFVWGKSLEE